MSNTNETQIQLTYVQKCSDLLPSIYSGRRPTYHIQNEGCQMNSLQTESVAAMMEKIGYEKIDSEEADAVIYNTCTVRENANQKIYGHLGHLKSIKRKNPDMKIILFGCMMQEQHVVDTIRKSYPFVNLVFGTHNIHKFPELFFRTLTSDSQIIDIWKESDEIVEGLPSSRKYSFKTGVNVMFGCNNFCTYCIVPYVRGRERSRKAEEIIKEVKGLAADGYKEIMLLGQNVNSYGNDLKESLTFPQLLRELDKIEGDFVIRFMSSHPKDATKELLDAIIECKKVAKHLHLPVQSGSNEILAAMNRRYTTEKYLEIVDYLRNYDADFSITTDLIVGFPNETADDFEKTLDLIKRVRYDNIYSFIYSKRTGTKAAEIEDKISDDEKSQRMRKLLEVQREITTESYKRFKGKTLRVLADGESRKKKGFLTGKSNEFIIVEFEGDASLIGQFVDVKITDAMNWAVAGELVKKGE